MSQELQQMKELNLKFSNLLVLVFKYISFILSFITSTKGPSFPHSSSDKKNSSLKARSAEEQATLLYMAYQQQHYLDDALRDAKAKVDEGCQVFAFKDAILGYIQ